MTAPGRPLRQPGAEPGRQVLSSASWPRGYCPTHAWTALRCTSNCVPTRVAFAALEVELRDYWQLVGLDYDSSNTLLRNV